MIEKNKPSGQWVDLRNFQQTWGLVALLTLAVFLLRVAYVQFWHPYGLAPDEAQYWTWLTHNDWSFLTKPPLTTWLMGVSTFVLGDTLLGVKLFALLGQGAVSLLGFAIAREIVQTRLAAPSRKLAGRDGEALTSPAVHQAARGDVAAGWWAWVLLTTVPLVAAGGLIMSPDAVLLPIWMAVVYSVVKALGRENERALCWTRWVIIGGLMGIGGLAKYSAAFFYPLLGVYLFIWRREWLMHPIQRPQVWVSGLIAVAFQAPVVIWNLQHQWMGLEHVLWQAGGSGDDYDTFYDQAKGIVQFVTGQIGVLGPVIAAMMLVAVLRLGWRVYRFRNVEQRIGAPMVFLVVVSGGILAGFFGLAFTAKVQANWPVLGTVTALLLLAVWLAQARARWVVWLAVAGVALNSVLTVMLMDTYKMRNLGVLPLKAKIDPTKDLRGWEEMGNLLGLLMYKLDNPVILSSRYQTLAPLMFHTPGRPEFAYVNAEGRRLNEYDVWPMPDLNGRLVVYMNENDALPEKVKGMFGRCEPWMSPLGVEEYGIVVRRLNLWLCWGGSRTVAER